jgi:MFS transporter, DHA1 family, multidrug resistance protein
MADPLPPVPPLPPGAPPQTALPPARFLDRFTPPHVATLVLLAGVSSLAMNIFLPALPVMAADFAVDYAVMQLSVTLYLIVNGILQIGIGPLSDRFGRRPVLLASLVLFLVATVGALFAQTVEMFLLCRMGQAVIVAAMVLSRAAIGDVARGDRAASLLAYVTMGMAIVPMLGPIAGGALADAFGWRSTFVVLLVLGIGLFALSWADMGETAVSRPESFRAQFAQYPGLFRARRFWGYALSATFCAGVFFAFLGGAPFVGTEVYGLSTAALGLYFGTPALGYLIGNFITGRMSRSWGMNRVLLWGAIATAAGLLPHVALMLMGLDSALSFFGSFIIVGIGNGMVIPTATAGTLSVRPALAGSAAGLSGAIMLWGGALMSALAGILLVPGAGAWPLIGLMLVSACASVAAALYVRHRTRIIEG